ncbi:hypothetical protein VTO73DRAFT_5011 [Trametes versicolor]
MLRNTRPSPGMEEDMRAHAGREPWHPIRRISEHGPSRKRTSTLCDHRGGNCSSDRALRRLLRSEEQLLPASHIQHPLGTTPESTPPTTPLATPARGRSAAAYVYTRLRSTVTQAHAVKLARLALNHWPKTVDRVGFHG